MTGNCKLRKAILPHFATKLWNITNFVILFQAVMKFLSRLVEFKILVNCPLKRWYYNPCSKRQPSEGNQEGTFTHTCDIPVDQLTLSNSNWQCRSCGPCINVYDLGVMERRSILTAGKQHATPAIRVAIVHIYIKIHRCFENINYYISNETIISCTSQIRNWIMYSCMPTIDILYTLDSASNYSAIQKSKPWLQSQVVPIKWEDSYFFYFFNRELKL
jgi:hypothetical protein